MIISRTVILAASLSFAACSVESNDMSNDYSAATKSHHEHGSTAKPGANVTFTTELREPLSPGDAGALEITMTEGHRSGTMRVKAKAGEGLELFTTIDEATFDLSEGDTHTWTVFFDTEDPGKFYINLQARVETPIGPLGRSYAAPIIVGTPEPKSINTTSQSVSDNEPVVVMEAVETIRQ
ncbi:MAG: hypothetical protein AAFY34_07535 [Pseudomonadota bacterium]